MSPRLDVKLTADEKDVLPLLVTGVLDRHPVLGEDIFLLSSSLETLPLSILRPLDEKDVNLARFKNLSERPDGLKRKDGSYILEDDVEPLFDDMNKKLNELQYSMAFDQLVTIAKRLTKKMHDKLGLRFTLFPSPSNFYNEVLHVFFNSDEQDVFVFSTTPGAFIPQEHWGSALHLKIPRENDEGSENGLLETQQFSKCASRRALWTKGILHGARKGCRIRYQFDLDSARTSFREGLESYRQEELREAYRREAERILAELLNTRNIELTYHHFVEMSERADFRSWLTYASEDYILISAREHQLKHMAEAILLDRDFFEEKIWNYLEDRSASEELRQRSVLEHVVYLYNKGQEELGLSSDKKSFDVVSDPKDAAERIIQWIEDKADKYAKS